MSTETKKKAGLGAGAGCLAMLLLFGLAAIMTPILMVAGFSGAAKNKGESQNELCGPGTGPNVVSPEVMYAGTWRKPLEGRLTSPYGRRLHPTLHIWQLHSGQDIAAPDGNAIVAAADGTVSIAGKSSGGNSGYMVAIEHGGGVQSRYVHSWPHGIHVKVGQKVKAGQHIADVGSSGNSTGPHLHFEIRVNGQPTPPIPYLQQRGVNLGTNKSEQIQTVNNPKKNPDSQKADPNNLVGTYHRQNGLEFKVNGKQASNLSAVIQAARKHGANDQATVIALMTVLQESKAMMYANSNVPESLNYPHDSIGSDHDSVGLFQQRPAAGWGPVQKLMNPNYSTNKFLNALFAIKGWENLPLGDAAQHVQISAFPDLYADWEPVAVQILKGTPTDPNMLGAQCPTQATTVLAINSDIDAEQARKKLITAATKGIGGHYKKGSRTFKQWDDAGFIYWTTQQAELRGIPYVDQWTAGQRTDDPEPGDLIVLGELPHEKWSQVGIMIDHDSFITVTRNGTKELPLPPNPVGYVLVPEDKIPEEPTNE